MKQQLTWQEIHRNPEWLPVIADYQQRSQVSQFEDYFDRPRSIHGVKHAYRVLFHTLLLCELCKTPEPDKELLVSAALFHDIGRDNDGLCFKHGKRSVEKMAALNLSPADPESAAISDFIITYHCIDDSRAEADLHILPNVFHERTWRLFRILKDSDGLDRVRIGDLDVHYLRNPESARLAELAHELLARI